MSHKKKPTKKQLLEAIKKLEKNPHDKVNILVDIGIGAVGAAGFGAAAAALGSTSILFGLVTIAAPVGVVVGGAALGGMALIGAKRVLFDGTFNEGKRSEMLNNLKEQYKEAQSKERADNIEDSDKTRFIISLKEPIDLDLISPEDAQKLIEAVEAGHVSITEAISTIQEIVKSAKS